MKSVTLRDVALSANVSISTVSRVIRNYQYIGEETKEKVQKSIKKLNYEPNTAARRLKYGRSYTIGFILPDISNPFFSNAIKAAYNYIQNSEYSYYEILFYNTDGQPEREKKAIDLFVARQMEGIIIASSASNLIIEHIRQILKSKNISIVAVDNQLGDLNIDLVTSDNYFGAYTLTTHLLDLGHESIAVITGQPNESSSKDRVDGYKKALKDHGITFNEKIVLVGDWTKESGVSETNRLLQLKPRPTAIFGFNNSMSMGALSVLKASGLRVPEDMALVSFDDVEYGDLIKPGLTCMNTSWYELGRISAQLLLDRFSSGKSTPRQCVKLPFEMIIRESCGYTISSIYSK
jgi:LacI family transcriptional regulator